MRDAKQSTKIALVTGSSRGIGREIALKLAMHDYTLIVSGRNQKDVESTCTEIKAKGGHAYPLIADLTSSSGLDLALHFVTETFNRLDLLVTNIGSGKTPHDTVVELNEWQRVFDINFFSAIRAVNAFLPFLEKSLGQIICISSIAGIEKISAPISYSVAKGALISYVKHMMRPLADKKIRINCISPGNVWIESGSWHNKMMQDPNRVNDIIQNQVALKQFVKPEEIAHAVWFVVSTPSLTGQNIVIDAGQTRQT